MMFISPQKDKTLAVKLKIVHYTGLWRFSDLVLCYNHKSQFILGHPRSILSNLLWFTVENELSHHVLSISRVSCGSI